jgi:flagellar basal-body rod protein FlgC
LIVESSSTLKILEQPKLPANFIDPAKFRFAVCWQIVRMSTVGAIALSGLDAATLRLDAAADNIANARSNGPLPDAANASAHAAAYTPLEVDQTPNANGGVSATLAPSTREAIATYDPHATYANADGFVAAPDIDLAGEMVQLISARQAFAASVQVIRTDDEIWASLLSIRA